MSEPTETETTTDHVADAGNMVTEGYTPASTPETGSANLPTLDDMPVDTPEPEAEPETFPAEYVHQLRQEAAEHRTRAKDRDTIAERLHVALTAATGRLADPSDLPFNEAHLTDPDALTAALDGLLTRKPHLAARTPRGDVGQGARTSPEPVDLAAMLRANAG